MEPCNKVKVITTNERDKSPRTTILPKDKYQLMGSKQQISSCKYPNTSYFVMQHCFPFYLCLTPLYTDAHMISWIPMEELVQERG
jgi:hypothetical protein